MNRDVTCQVCSKPFTVHESVIELGRGKYCSRTCYNAARQQASPARFWSQVERGAEGDCWLWTGSTTGPGYGQVCINSVLWLVHRYAWTLTHGPIPAGRRIRHHCQHLACVNPKHLFMPPRYSR